MTTTSTPLPSQASLAIVAELAAQLRVDSIRASTSAGSGHPTSSMSAADLLAVLVTRHLHYDWDAPHSPANDHLIFSKGHASPLLYAVFKAVGVVSTDELVGGYRRFGQRLQGHPTPVLPWVDVATGSLGQGLADGVGIALAGKYLERESYRVWVLCGDSELAEGSVWEALDKAAYYRLSNLVAIVDVNRLGQRGATELGWDLDAYAARVEAFGARVLVIDGHDLAAIDDALAEAAHPGDGDFPRLMSFAAADRFLPRWFTKRGQRLVYSNGVLALSAAAALVTLAFRADYNRMLPLYAIGVFTSFTFSQAGMTRRHLRLREPGWRYGIAVNGVGAVVTFLVLLDIIATKFAAGAWIVLLILPLLVLLLDRTNRAYAREREELEVEAPELLAPPKPRHEVLVLVDGLDRAVVHALQYAGQLNPLSITALHVAADPDTARRLARLWARLPGAVPLEVVHCPNRDLVDCATDAVDERARPDTEVTVLLPRHGDRGRFRRLLHDQTGRDLFAALNRLAGVNVAIVHMPAAAARHPATSASARTMVP